ncbi:formylglycine-generating enzyme family protein [Bradyrhizobium sp. PMVTL-01]|uniref:formylglycine-generating enzyme family protein n=1 Tax=Bradyrhizobium sp. PMVTL-01 TaxID=3434999 RepID=UPI003F70DD71
MLRADLDHCEWLPDDMKTGEMVFIPGGTFRMGSDHHYPEEAPSHRVCVDGFWIDRTPVTNRQFKKFVNATGQAQVSLISRTIPVRSGRCSTPARWYSRRCRASRILPTGASGGPSCAVPFGAILTARPRYQGTRRPPGRARLLYGRRAGKDLPTEAEWEFAARGGLDGEEFAWGDAPMPGGRHMANVWQGNFPVQNVGEDGFERTSPVMAFPPNGYGLHDMIGNVWEWTSDWWSSRHPAEAARPCCIPRNPRGGDEEASHDPSLPDIRIPRKVLKGGSHLCAPNCCRRYRPAARHAEAIDTSTSHVGFRCVVRSPLGIREAAPGRHPRR